MENKNDNVNHPSHYTTGLPTLVAQCDECGTTLKREIECIDVIRNMPTWKGNVIKYTWRAGLKKDAAMEDIDKEIEDLEKAKSYLDDRIEQLVKLKTKNKKVNVMDKEEAIKIVKSHYPTNKQILNEDLEVLIPEFKEKTDEEIRKWLIGYFNQYIIDGIQMFGNGLSVKDIITWLEKQVTPEDKGDISDGYHTFNELYYYRMLYNAAFFNSLPKELVHKSKKHHDGEECFGGGWFVVMANLPTGQISNHYELKDWELFQIPEKEVADEWDGHTPKEAAERLHKYLLENQNKPIERKDFISIPFGTDSELIEEIIRIPKGYIATIEDNKIHIKKKDTSATEAIKSNHTVDNNEMVESTFKVGDWVVRTNGENFCNSNKFAQIQSIPLYEEMCYLDTGKWLYPSELRLWTINDAEPGDVLVCPKYAGDVMPNIFIFKDIDINNDVLCYCSFLKVFATGGYIASADPINTDFYPANKEQYNLLFKKMKESGYKWNTDKKELKKLN